MKKYISLIMISIITLSGFAQDNGAEAGDITTKKGKVIALPDSGDIAVGLNAVPYVNMLGTYAGNIFNGNLGNNLNVGVVLGQQEIYGQYYINSSSSARIALDLNSTKTQNTAYVQDDAKVSTDPNAQVEDLQVILNYQVGVELSYLRYLNDNRWRPYYGGSLIYNRNKLRYRYDWGNEMTVDNTNPTSTAWSPQGALGRTTMYDNGISQTLALGAIFGTEYYWSTNFSFGGEFGIFGAHTITSQRDYEYEIVEQNELKTKQMARIPSNAASMLQSTASGRIYMMFHF